MLMRSSFMTGKREQGRTGRNLVFVLIFIIGGLLLYFGVRSLLPSRLPISHFPSKALDAYFQAEEEYGIPWYCLAAIDLQEKRSLDKVNYKTAAALAEALAREEDEKKILSGYSQDRTFLEGALTYVKRLRYIDQVFRDKIFPIDGKYESSYRDDWGDDRSYGGKRRHEGIDIICRKGTPIASVGPGMVEQKGWNRLGGWRIGIRGDDGIYYYYAHMSRYAPGFEIGDRVQTGDIIGYVGDSGYGPEGTTGKFVPHLHFGMYEKDEAISPYPFLKAWEKRKGIEA
jgi:murein DD-endopeptidase MepM/ murein hydrolase activator NlpD